MKKNQPVRLQSDDVLYFAHIPKTGGLSLFSLLRNHFHTNEVYVGAFFAFPAALQGVPPKSFEQFRLIRAHVPVQNLAAMHDQLPTNPVCVTMLRDPVERTISHFEHNLRRIQNGEYSSAQLLEDVISTQHFKVRYRNFQTRFLGGLVRRSSDDFKHLIVPVLLDLAKQRLEQMAFFGLTSRYAESAALLNYTFGWPPGAEVPFVNRAPQYSYRDTVSEKVQELILEQVELDLELLRFAEQLFDERYRQMLATETQ